MALSHVTKVPMSHVAPVPHVSHVDFLKANAMSLIFMCMLLGYMSHVEFKKLPCRRVRFKHQGSFTCVSGDGGFPSNSILIIRVLCGGELTSVEAVEKKGGYGNDMGI